MRDWQTSGGRHKIPGGAGLINPAGGQVFAGRIFQLHRAGPGRHLVSRRRHRGTMGKPGCPRGGGRQLARARLHTGKGLSPESLFVRRHICIFNFPASRLIGIRVGPVRRNLKGRRCLEKWFRGRRGRTRQTSNYVKGVGQI